MIPLPDGIRPDCRPSADRGQTGGCSRCSSRFRGGADPPPPWASLPCTERRRLQAVVRRASMCVERVPFTSLKFRGRIDFEDVEFERVRYFNECHVRTRESFSFTRKAAHERPRLHVFCSSTFGACFALGNSVSQRRLEVTTTAKMLSNALDYFLGNTDIEGTVPGQEHVAPTKVAVLSEGRRDALDAHSGSNELAGREGAFERVSQTSHVLPEEPLSRG